MKKENLDLSLYKTIENTIVPGCFFTLFLVFFAFCTQASVDKRYVDVKNDMKILYHWKLPKDIEQLIFINDNGCSNCIESFSNYVLNNMNRYQDNAVIFINSTGRNVDLDKFSSFNSNNIIISRSARQSGEVIPDLGVVFMKKQVSAVDTIIYIDADEITAQLQYISKYK